ncbi:MAG: hypothetical protein ABSA93_09280 [Streptosporangiaceae bacterium]
MPFIKTAVLKSRAVSYRLVGVLSLREQRRHVARREHARLFGARAASPKRARKTPVSRFVTVE